MMLTINSILEALRAHGGRFGSLKNVRLLSPEPTMPGNGLVDFEVSIEGIDCTLRCPLRMDNDVREKLRSMDGWRLVENELVVLRENGEIVATDVLVCPLKSEKSREPAHEESFEEYVWDPVWGLATVMEDGEWWLLDANGRILTPAPFDWLGEVSEGLIVAQRGDKFGYIDTEGREVVPFIYTDANSFCDGQALVTQGAESFYIDKNFVPLKS